MSDVLTKIGNLLRKAERTDNEHEADAYLGAAQRLATLAQVDLAVARSHVAQGEQREEVTRRTITIGDRGKRGLANYARLFMGIGNANGLRFDIAANSTHVYAYGLPSAIDVTERLYESLVVQMVAAAELYLRTGEFAQDTTWRRNRQTGEWEPRPVHRATARATFQSAFVERVTERLHDAAEAARQERAADQPSAASSTDLAIRAVEVEVSDFHRRTSNARPGTWRGQRQARGSRDALRARVAGDEAGERARLSESTAIGGQGRQIGGAQ